MVTKPAYVPRRGDAVWIDFNPQAGHEQVGRRPAVVLSHRAYNEKTGLVILCPITSRVEGYPFEAPIPLGLEVTGVFLADQLKSVDWRTRSASLIASLPAATVEAVLEWVGLLPAGDDG